MKMKTIIVMVCAFLVLLVPTVAGNEMLSQWLMNDTTNDNEYVTGEYMCSQFAIDMVRNGSDAGFEMLTASIPGHIIVFVDINCTGYFIDAMTDEYLNLSNASVFVTTWDANYTSDTPVSQIRLVNGSWLMEDVLTSIKHWKIGIIPMPQLMKTIHIWKAVRFKYEMV